MARNAYAASAPNRGISSHFVLIVAAKIQNDSAIATTDNVKIFGRHLRIATNSNHFVRIVRIAVTRYGRIPPISKPRAIIGSLAAKYKLSNRLQPCGHTANGITRHDAYRKVLVEAAGIEPASSK